jgi:hypothetical protein
VPLAGQVDLEAARLRVLEEADHDARLERIGGVHSHATSHASIALSVVSAKHGQTNR